LSTADGDRPGLLALSDPANRPNPYPIFDAILATAPYAVMNGDIAVVADHQRCATMPRDPGLSRDRRRTRLPAGSIRPRTADGRRCSSRLIHLTAPGCGGWWQRQSRHG
jgi:hypothetical protein